VTLRVIIVVGGIVLLALFAKRMLVVVLPVIIALLLATLLMPLAKWFRDRNTPPALASALAVGLALVVFLGLWALVIPPFVSQVPDVVKNVQQGAGQIGDAAKPLGLSDREVQDAIERARDQLQGGQVAGKVLSGAMLLVQWAAAVILIIVLTFFFIKDGRQLRDWTVCLFAEPRRETLREITDRAWGALATYVQGVFLVATLDAVLIGIVLVAVGVPIALPLIVLTFIAAFFPIVGAVMAGVAATLVALVSGGIVDAAIVLVAIIAIQQLEGNVFYPMVVGKRLQLHPVAILLALTAGGVLAGVAGAFLAIPVAAVTSAVLDYMRNRRRELGQELLVTP
jgi:predicted PurR-regulated permease PerM